MNFSLSFFDKKHKEERLIWRWKYIRGLNSVMYKKKKS